MTDTSHVTMSEPVPQGLNTSTVLRRSAVPAVASGGQPTHRGRQSQLAGRPDGGVEGARKDVVRFLLSHLSPHRASPPWSPHSFTSRPAPVPPPARRDRHRQTSTPPKSDRSTRQHKKQHREEKGSDNLRPAPSRSSPACETTEHRKRQNLKGTEERNKKSRNVDPKGPTADLSRMTQEVWMVHNVAEVREWALGTGLDIPKSPSDAPCVSF
ncbi:unnamed protein product [Boreogadus saida]